MTLRGRRGLLKLSDCHNMGERGLCPYNFYSGWKRLIHSSSCFICGILVGGGWLQSLLGGGGGEGLAENVRIPPCVGGGLKLLKKSSYDIWTFPKTVVIMVIKWDLLHLLENTFDRKHISANLSPTRTLTLKHNNVFGLTKWRHFFEIVYRYQSITCIFNHFGNGGILQRKFIHFRNLGFKQNPSSKLSAIDRFKMVSNYSIECSIGCIVTRYL